MSLRFTEHNVELQTDTVFNFLKSSGILLVTAPYRLLNEMSIKVIFLKKEQVDSILVGSVIVGGFVIALTAGLQILTGQFSLVKGKLPLAIMCCAVVFLVLTCVVFNSMSDVIYKHRDRLHFTTSSGCSADGQMTEMHHLQESNLEERGVVSPQPVDATVEKAVSTMTNTADNGAPEVKVEVVTGHQEAANPVGENADSAINADLYENEAVIAYHSRYTNGVVKAMSAMTQKDLSFTEEELQVLLTDMNGSTEPSKFIPEDVILDLQKQKSEDDVSFLEELNLGIIPVNFTALT